MDWDYTRLSAMMFMEYAVWGAWMPVLAARLLGPLKMTGKQTGWIYITLPVASMISPLIAGQLADKYVDARWVLAAAHIIGAVLMYVAAKTDKFTPLFIVMLLYSMCYAATIPLVNSVMFSKLTDPGTQAAMIFIWAPVAWALAGYALTGWRMTRKTEGDGSDCLVFAAILSVVMAAVCVLQLPTPPQGGEGIPMFDAPGDAQRHGFRDLHRGVAVHCGNDAVLLPRHGSVHAGHGCAEQERAGLDGDCPGCPGAGHAVGLELYVERGGPEMDVDDRRRLLAVAVRGLRGQQSAMVDCLFAVPSRAGIRVLHHCRPDVCKREGLGRNRRFPPKR